MSHPAVRCREITAADTVGVVDVLTAVFEKQRDRAFWREALLRLEQRPVPAGFPRYGFLLESGGRPVGVLLQIFAPLGESGRVRCNVSSWCVLPGFQAFGSLLVSRAFRYAATYTNITPAPQTLPILEAQGYQRYCRGRVIGVPMLAAGRAARVRAFDRDRDGEDRLGAAHAILHDHAGWGCLCLVGEAGDGLVPFVFAPRVRLGVARFAVLVYADAATDMADFAGGLGRHLARRGYAFMVVDADAPIPGLPGVFFDNKPKYFRGPDRPAINDHAYTERAVFGS